MNNTDWIRSIIDAPSPVAVPIMTHPGIELIGKKVIDTVTDGQTHYEAIRALHERFPQAAAATVIMDLTVEAEAFGAQLHTSDDEVPSILGSLVHNYDEVAALEVPSLQAGRVQQYLKANRLAAENIGKPVFGGAIGPFSLAGRLFDMTEIMMAIYTEPDTIRLLLEKCTAFITTYIKAIKETGVAGVIIAEPAAGLLSNEDCQAFSSDYLKGVIAGVQDDGFMVILHNCGNTGHCTPAMVSTGAKAYHFGNKIDMVDALEGCPADVLVMGNLDPVGVFKAGTPEEIVRKAKELLARTAKYPNFVLSSGCDTPPEVPFDNIEAFYSVID